MITDTDSAVFIARYNANMNRELATHYYRAERMCAVIAALAASGTLSSSLAAFPVHLTQALAALAAIAAAVQPIMHWSQKYAAHCKLAMAYQEIETRAARTDPSKIDDEMRTLDVMEPIELPWGHKSLSLRVDAATRRELGRAPQPQL